MGYIVRQGILYQNNLSADRQVGSLLMDVLLIDEDGDFTVLQQGTARGQLVGGNLSVMTATLGSPYEIDTRGKILLIEEVGEQPYRLDRMLTSLSLSGKFRDCSGILLGGFTNCDAPAPETISPNAITAGGSLSLKQIIQEVVMPWGKPVLSNLQAGHLQTQMTLPMGAVISMDLRQNSAHLCVL